MLALTFQSSWSWKGMKTHQANSDSCQATPWKVTFSTWVSQMFAATEAWTSLWPTHLQESYPITPHLPIFLYLQQIGARNCSGNCVCFLLLHRLPPNGASKTLSFSNTKPCVILSYLMADPALRRSIEVPSHCNYLCSYDIKCPG